jgi:hypothetical protein
MAKSTQPIFTRSALLGIAQATVANSNLDGTGTLVTVATGDPEGTRIDLVALRAIVTTTAGMIRLFVYDGANARLLKEIPVTAITPSGTVEAFSAEWQPTEPIVLPDDTYELRASTENAEAMNVFAFGGHFS